MSLLAKWFGFPGVLRRCVVAAVGVYIAFGVPLLAEEKASPLVFFLLNHEPGQSFDADAWGAAQSLVALKGDTLVTHSTSDVGKLPRILEAAKDADPRETVIVLSTAQIDAADPALFAEWMRNYDDAAKNTPETLGTVVFIDEPLCRVMQLPLAPTDYVPGGIIVTTLDSEATFECYKKAIELHVRRTQGWDLDAAGNRIVAIDATAERAQDMMPPAKSMGWMLADTADPDRRKKRDSSVFASGDEIVIRTTLDYIRKQGAGYPGARYEIELDVEIKAPDGPLIERMEDVTRYVGEMRHRVPVDAEYFRNWFVASIRLQEPGAYKVVFLLTDRMAPEDKQIPVPIEVDVTVE